MDFSIFYDYFRGLWQDDQVGYISEIGWDDDFFNYDNPLVGFYKDSKGAYMARYSYSHYTLYFIPEDDRDSMYQYVININEDGTTTVPELPGFTRLESIPIRFSFRVEGEQIQNLFSMTPHVFRIGKEGAERLRQTETLTDTASCVLNLYHPD